MQETLLLLLAQVLCLILWLVSLDHAAERRLYGVSKSARRLAELGKMQARFALLRYKIATFDQVDGDEQEHYPCCYHSGLGVLVVL